MNTLNENEKFVSIPSARYEDILEIAKLILPVEALQNGTLRFENEGGHMACRLISENEILPVKLEIDNVERQKIGTLRDRKTLITLESSHGKGEL